MRVAMHDAQLSCAGIGMLFTLHVLVCDWSRHASILMVSGKQVVTLGNVPYWQASLFFSFSSAVSLLSLQYELMATGHTEAGEPSGRPAVGVMAEQLAQLLGAVKDGMREELSSLKRELTSDRQAADDCLLKKLKLEKVPTFKKKAHEKQFVFNEEVSSKVKEATAALAETPPAVEKAKTLLKEGKKLLSEGQKLIRMADRSEHSWAMVEEYIDELANNSNDEERIQRAEVRVGGKLKAAAAKSGKQKKAGTPLPRRFSQSVIQKAFPAAHVAPASAPSCLYCHSLSRSASLGQPLGPCFECGKLGNFR